MQNNKIIFLFVLLFLTSGNLYSQEEEFTSRPKGRQYSLVAYISGGGGYYVSNSGAPSYLQPNLSKWNQVYTVRVLWHPNNLLKAGIETGYVNFYSYELTDSSGKKGKIALNAIPLLLEWSMSLKNRLNIFAGSGLYFLDTKLNYEGSTTSKKLSVGWMAAASYIQPIGKETGIGAEIKWLYAAETSNGTICAQIQFVWKFLRW